MIIVTVLVTLKNGFITFGALKNLNTVVLRFKINNESVN